MNHKIIDTVPFNNEEQSKLLEEALKAAGAEIKRLSAENTRLRADIASLQRYH